MQLLTFEEEEGVSVALQVEEHEEVAHLQLPILAEVSRRGGALVPLLQAPYKPN